MMDEKQILVHCCCGPCSTSSIERLLREGYAPTLFFSNSNIFPKTEFDKRYDALKIVANHYKLPFICDVYQHEQWLAHIKGFENEKEHGKRCTLCFGFSLKRAYEYALMNNIPYFCTTLTVSRFKNSQTIFEVGEQYESFLKLDFKKQNGFQRSIELAKELGLYRQQYCGCEFSMRN